MERLSFGPENKYNAVELAIHLSRYLTARNLCRGLSVLDVACGEGYGAYAMASFWGAKSVTGVDVSEEAVNTARNLFPHPNVEYIASTAESIDELFAPGTFDLVVSLETIEHVKDPEKFLSAIRKVLKPGGIVILSCPNDHWLYGPGETQNPFHLRTYYFNEFKEQAEKYLGEANCFLFGRPVNGFGNFLPIAKESGAAAAAGKKMAEEFKRTDEIRVSRIGTDQPLSAENCLYFVGVWGDLPVAREELVDCAFYPIQMNRFSVTVEDLHPRLESVEKWAVELQTALRNSETRISELEGWTVELQTSLRNSENHVLELEKLAAELQSSLEQAQEELIRCRAGEQKMGLDLNDSDEKIGGTEEGDSLKGSGLLGKFKNSFQLNKKDK